MQNTFLRAVGKQCARIRESLRLCIHHHTAKPFFSNHFSDQLPEKAPCKFSDVLFVLNRVAFWCPFSWLRLLHRSVCRFSLPVPQQAAQIDYPRSYSAFFRHRNRYDTIKVRNKNHILLTYDKDSLPAGRITDPFVKFKLSDGIFSTEP